MGEITTEDYANVFGSFMETALDCTERMNNELEEKEKKIQEQKKKLDDAYNFILENVQYRGAKEEGYYEPLSRSDFTDFIEELLFKLG